MAREGMRHAWSVLCDRAFIDRDSNNVSVDVVEQLNIPLPEIPQGARGVLLPHAFELVSLWYRLPDDKPSKERARLRLEDPEGKELGGSIIEVDLTTATRYRSRARLPMMPVTGPGIYYFVMEQESGESWKQVARVPLEVANAKDPPSTKRLPTRAAEPTTPYGGAKGRRTTKKR